MLFLIIGLAACNQTKEEILSEEPGAAKLNFVSLSDMKYWFDNAPNLQWGIAMSSKDITTVSLINPDMESPSRSTALPYSTAP
jgi:hypothetical protein